MPTSGKRPSEPLIIIGHSGRAPLLAALLVLPIVALPLACLPGQYPLDLAQIRLAFAQFFGFAPAPRGDEATIYAIVIDIRLARAAAALCCGGSLALSGAILQGALRNPLADPFTLGISAGAACGASLALVAGAGVATASGLGLAAIVSLAALAGSLLALALALLLGRSRGALNRENVILAGIAVASFLGALVALVKSLNEESVASIVFWIMGSLQGAGWQSLPILLIALAPGLLATAWGWRKLDALALGDSQAGWLGLDPGRARFWLLLGASCMTAGCVAVAGIIGFVGLVAPHILRIILGPAHGPLLAASFPVGGVFLLACDCAARTILDGGQELPVGVVTALCGAPLFAWLIWRKPA